MEREEGSGKPHLFDDELSDIDDAIEFLKKKVELWSFSRLLSNLYVGEEPLQKRLTEKLMEYDGTKERDTVSRKVRNWLADRNLPENREEIFKICFALDLDEPRSEMLLGITAENGIHYRNPRELVYAFGLRKRIDYPNAKSLAEELWGEELPSGTLRLQNEVRKNYGKEDCGNMTGSVRNEFKRIETDRELEDFFKTRREYFGFHHNTAYRKFVKMLNYLLFPDGENPDLPVEKNYSVERVVREYLRMEIPYEKRHSRYTRLQKEVKSHWPTPKMIHDMYSRKSDVNRKTLLLLYLATEGLMPDQSGDRRKCIKEHYRRIDMMLADCGMAVLNLHSPFDYLVIQSINKKDMDEFMSLRMERMLDRLFSPHPAAAYVAEKEK